MGLLQSLQLMHVAQLISFKVFESMNTFDILEKRVFLLSIKGTAEWCHRTKTLSLIKSVIPEFIAYLSAFA